MLKRFIALLFTVVLAGSVAHAQEIPTGFTAQGSAVVQAVFAGIKINLGAEVGFENRGQQLRIDVSRLSVPGSDPTMNALIQQFLPQGSFTAVLDRASHTIVLWSTERRKYYTISSTTATTASPATIMTSGSILQGLEFAKTLKDMALMDMQVNLSGHSTINGHPATVVHYSLREQKRGGALTATSGDFAFADDQQGLPVRVTSVARGRNFTGSFRLDFRTLSAVPPDASAFTPPDGFTKASDPSEIFGNLSSAFPH